MSTLGIDLGTSKVAAVICDDCGNLIVSASALHEADLHGLACGEQDVSRQLDTARRVMLQLPEEQRRTIRAIGITGQMHGVTLLNRTGRSITPLINWQDQRCLADPRFLGEITEKTGHVLRSGYGSASVLWLHRQGWIAADAASACDIGALLAMQLCGLSAPVMEPTFAASFGLFDLRAMDWDRAAVACIGFPVHLLPRVVTCGSKVGVVASSIAGAWGLPGGIPVSTAIGDNQASMLATLEEPDKQLNLTLGTGGQLSAIAPSEARWLAGGATWECRPFVGGKIAVVAAALAGGAAWAWLERFVESTLTDMGGSFPGRDAVYARLDELGLAATTELVVLPHIHGERHDPSLRAGIVGLDESNFRLGPLARGLARGIVSNLRDMLPAELFAGRTQIVASGNALRRSALMRLMAEQALGVPLVLTQRQEEAATGAAMLARRLIG